ncbi:MAG: hypothetical protein ACPGYL_15320, partial [Rhodospirillaceae bacterium]
MRETTLSFGSISGLAQFQTTWNVVCFLCGGLSFMSYASRFASVSDGAGGFLFVASIASASSLAFGGM